MPIYEYRCASCGGKFEIIQKVNSRPLRKCRECDGRLEKLISRTSFQLKGGGWYLNDYSRSSSAAKTPSTENSTTKDAAKSTSKGSSKSDS